MPRTPLDAVSLRLIAVNATPAAKFLTPRFACMPPRIEPPKAALETTGRFIIAGVSPAAYRSGLYDDGSVEHA